MAKIERFHDIALIHSKKSLEIIMKILIPSYFS